MSNPQGVRHPKDKALVENAVRLMYRSVYVAVEGMAFHSLETLSIYHGFRLITAHQCSDGPYEYTTESAHNLPVCRGSHKTYLKAFRSCRGILSLEKKYSLKLLVSACACASEMRAYGYQQVLEILHNDTDINFMPDDDDQPLTLPRHKNIRGRGYFKKSK